ncbi:MAG: ABC transporter permease [Oscillospiraceae bacterium]|nr:ABC transporter permease [Oscillospiraceae bacterium]
MNKNRYTKEIAQEALAAQSEVLEGGGLWDSLREMLKANHAARAGAIFIVLLTLGAIFAPLIAPYDPAGMDLANRLSPPSWQHLMGTDDTGRDLFTRVLYGGRVSLTIGLIPSFISLVIGTVLGLISGYFGGKTDFAIMRLADVMLAFPSLLLAMVIMYIMGSTLLNLFIALSIINWAGTARIVRAQTLALKEKEFVESARSMGVRRFAIMFRHILPNCLPSLIVLFTLDIPAAIMAEASLSFLGVGAQPPTASWGLMVNLGKQFAYNCPWLILAPGLSILLVVMAFNFLGDGLRDAIDPYMKA